ncbi:MAG: CDGSH iron-sulfur domain-containing protein [Thermoplasmataceae archaeon]|jgi:CDGSH-type Zn-finger protein|nr:CDGSH iron-sulfur domain-containing protein [Candidatus Thermoplasmatota archaeon]
MSRLVLHERNRPYAVKVGDQEVHICGCGLSANKPFCDGTHKKTLDEKDKLFFYDKSGNRVEMDSFYNNP